MKKILFFLMFWMIFGAQAYQDPFVSNGVFIVQEGKTLNLQCEAVSLGTVLQTLAEHLHFNLLLTEPLTQSVSMNVRGIAQDQIIDQLLSAYQLQATQNKNLTVISPAFSPTENQEAEIFILKYANAQDLVDTLKSRVNAGFDSRTNALIVYDAQDKMDWLRDLIAQIDVPAKQVYIEATIMNASAQFTQELGLRFHVDEFSVTRFPHDFPLNVKIAAAQENHQTQVIANPKLLTVNLQEAQIKQGKQLAYQETSASGATSLTFQEAALELRVTPMITPEHDILLDLMVKQDVIGAITINGQPTIDTKSIQAKVRVKDGETIVLGGIYSEMENKADYKVPLLSRIPLLGKLFEDHRRHDDNDELLIFVTPRVVL